MNDSGFFLPILATKWFILCEVIVSSFLPFEDHVARFAVEAVQLGSGSELLPWLIAAVAKPFLLSFPLGW